MSVPRPSTATASLGRFASGGRPQFNESGSGSRHQFPPFEADIDYHPNPNPRAGFGSGQRPRPQSYHAQIHQETPQHPHPHHSPPGASAPIRASVGRTFPSDVGQGAGQHPGGPRASSISIQNSQPPVTRYVCFQKKPNKNIWKNEWETCDHITMSIGPEETERQIRRHNEPGKDLVTSISRLGKYQIRHLRKHEDKLNVSEKDSKSWKWVVSAVGKEKKPGGSSQTFWAIYSREPRVRPTNTSARPPTRAQTFAHPTKTVPRHEDPGYDGPIVVQSVEIPAPPRPNVFPGARPSTAGGYTSGQYFANDFLSEAFPAPATAQPSIQPTSAGFGPLPGPQLREIRPGSHAPFPPFPGSGPHIREVDPGRSTSFSQFQGPSQSTDAFLRPANRTQPAVEVQNFGYQQPHSAEPRPSMPGMSSMPAAPLHRQQSVRVDQPFQPEAKRSPRHSDVRPAIKYTPPQQEQRRKRSNSIAAPRVHQDLPEIRYNDHVDTRKNQRSALDLPPYSEDKMHRTDRWLESSISGSSGTGTSTVGSGDGGSVVGEYVLNPPPMGRRRDSVSTYAGKDYYTNSSAGGLTRGRSFNEGARRRRSTADDYYIDSRPAAQPRRATQDYDLQYANNPQSRSSPKYVGYHGVGRRRSPSRKRSRSRHYGGRDSGPEDYEYESADEATEAMGNLRVNNSTARRGPPRPGTQYRRLRGLVEYGR